jgi:hypothetical protein
MSLSDCRIGAAVAVPDIEVAREVYEGKLGLSAVDDDPNGGRTYACGAATNLDVFPSPTRVPRAPPSSACRSTTSSASSPS